MSEAINDEVKYLLRRGKFKVILKEEILDGANIFTARYVLAIESAIDGKIKFKAFYVPVGIEICSRNIWCTAHIHSMHSLSD